MNRFFCITQSAYESVRNEMDSKSGYPNNMAETWFSPSNNCPKDKDGNCLFACIQEIAERIAPVAIKELTQDEYDAELLVIENL